MEGSFYLVNKLLKNNPPPPYTCIQNMIYTHFISMVVLNTKTRKIIFDSVYSKTKSLIYLQNSNKNVEIRGYNNIINWSIELF